MCHPRPESIFSRARFAVPVMVLFLSVAFIPATNIVARADGDLAVAIHVAGDNFKPITDEQLAAAKADLNGQIQALERFVNPNSDNGKQWISYLALDDTKKQLSADAKPESAPLMVSYGKLNRDENGLELPQFRNLSESLWKYVNLLGLSRAENQADTYSKNLDAFANDVAEYEKAPTAALAATIGRRLKVFAAIGQSPELVSAVKKQFAQPNALVDASAKLLNASASEKLNRIDPVNDTILGTSIHGTGRTTGSVAAKTVPSPDRAKVKLTTQGHTDSENVGRNGPAVICSTGHTDFTATKVVELTDNAFRAAPAQVAAHTNSDIHSVSKAGGGLGSNLVSRMGMQKVQQKHAQADSIASDHAEGRIARRIDQEVSDRLSKARKRYNDDYRLPLARRGELPEDIHFMTTDDALLVQVTQANRSQLGAPSEPPAIPAGKDLVVRMHESATNNYLASLLGGATISEDDPAQDTKADVPLPKWLHDAWANRLDKHTAESDPDFKPWSLKFNNERPIEVAFVDGKVRLTLHIAHLSSGHEFSRWDVTGDFAPEIVDGGVTLHRENLDAYPVGPDLKPLAEHSSTQSGERQNLLDDLTKKSDQGRGFPKTIEIKEIKPTGDLAKVGTLAANEFIPKDGWLTVAWNRE